MLRHLNHIDQQRLEERPANADFVYFFQVPDGVPAVVAGGDHQFGASGQNLVPLDFQADIALLAITADTIEAAAAAAAEIVLLARASSLENLRQYNS
jgi:hypothetical protein